MQCSGGIASGCPAGYYSAANSGSSTACPNGQYSAAYSGGCSQCTGTTYSWSPASGCNSCPAGYAVSEAGGYDAAAQLCFSVVSILHSARVSPHRGVCCLHLIMCVRSRCRDAVQRRHSLWMPRRILQRGQFWFLHCMPQWAVQRCVLGRMFAVHGHDVLVVAGIGLYQLPSGL